MERKTNDSNYDIITLTLQMEVRVNRKRELMGKAHKNCIIGKKFCLHHITGTAFIIRLKLYVYIVENSESFQKIYSFMQFK